MEEEREAEARGGWLLPSCPNNISLRSARLLWRATSGSPRGVADLLNAGASSYWVVGTRVDPSSSATVWAKTAFYGLVFYLDMHERFFGGEGMVIETWTGWV